MCSSDLLDASGNLLVGTTTASGYWGSSSVSTKELIAYSDSNTTYNSANKGLVINNTNTTTGNYSSLVFATTNLDGTPVAVGSVYSINEAARVHDYTTGSLAFATVGGSGVLSERMRIDSSGNVGIGTSSPTFKLQVDGGSGNEFKIEIGRAHV